MRRILVTGGTGVVGRAFVMAAPQDAELILLVRKKPSDLRRNVQTIIHDLTKTNLPDLPLGIDTIVHLAQEPNFRAFPELAAKIFAVNTAAAMQLLDWGAATGVRRFVLASTGGLYAALSNPVMEDDAVAISEGPLAFYYATKQAAELIAQRYHREMTIAVLRFFFVYGRGQSPSMLFPRLIASVRDGRPIHLAGPDGLVFNPVHANDAGAAVAAASAITENLIANIAGPEVVTMRMLGEQIGTLVNRPVTFETVETEASPRMLADIGRMQRCLFNPTVNIAKGLADMITA